MVTGPESPLHHYIFAAGLGGVSCCVAGRTARFAILARKFASTSTREDDMTRSISLPAFIALLLLARTLSAQEQDFSKVQITVTKVSGNIYMLEGEGGNIAASVGDDGIVIVDDQYAPLADKIAAALKNIGVTDKPVRFVINTHYHGDHTGGNTPFATKGATVIAQDNVRKRLETGGKAGNGGSIAMDVKPAEKGALPIITFDHDVTVHLNGEDIRALHFPAGHTDGDAIIFFPKANVVHMGDDYVRYGFPFIDVASGGSVEGMIAACDKVIALLPPDVKVIPGHGQISNLNEVRDYVTMLKGTTAAVEAALKKGSTLDQMKKDKILAAWDKQYANKFITQDVFIETLYNSLTNQGDAPFVHHN
jgi:cyclase